MPSRLPRASDVVEAAAEEEGAAAVADEEEAPGESAAIAAVGSFTNRSDVLWVTLAIQDPWGLKKQGRGGHKVNEVV